MDCNTGLDASKQPKCLNTSSYINGYNYETAQSEPGEMVVMQILRYPRLDTVLMVEQFIKKRDGEFKKKKLWQKLPKKMMYQTFCVVIDYLLYSGKISIDAEGKIGWIYYPERAKYWLKQKHLEWRPR